MQEAEKYTEGESELEEDAAEEHEEQCQAREIERTEKKFAKENEKLVGRKACIGRGRAPLKATRHGRVYAARERARNGQGGTQA